MTKQKLKVWVLTRDHNLYDQQGSYFCGVWINKPSVKQLVEWFKKHPENTPSGSDVAELLDFILHVESGGGRRATEDTWFNLEHVEVGD